VLQLLFGVPIGFVLLMATLIYLHTSHTIPLSVVPINMQGGISSFVMLSIPFFILAGYVMTEGGLSKRLTDFVITLVGRFRGGMLQVIVVSMYIMSGISGSTTMENASRHMVPYLIVVTIGLLLVAFVPWFSLVVPKMLQMI
jgi:TRAP-type C4-dicarboxylate transport system permease large subunit